MITDYLNKKKELVETHLNALLPKADQEPVLIHEAMHYSVFAGGKRLRPILVLAVGETLGVDESYLIEPACAIECIHTYSLIHDDLPCIDNDDIRRGKATSHKVYGDAIAVLTGDALLTWAFHIIARSKLALQKPHMAARIITCISEAVSTFGMIGGQVLDISYEKNKISEEDVVKMEFMKTAKLIQASVMVPSIIGEVYSRQQTALSTYGKEIGLAFQIVDDLLDIKGDEERIGKTGRKDLKAGKATLPSLLGYEAGLKRAEQHIKNAQMTVADFDKRKLLTGIADFIIKRTS